MIDAKIIAYRRRHPKCKFCKYIRSVDPILKGVNAPSFFECRLKDKIVNEELPRWFCRWFEVRELE